MDASASDPNGARASQSAPHIVTVPSWSTISDSNSQGQGGRSADLTFLGSALAGTGPPPPFEDAADVNDNGLVDVFDLVSLGNVIDGSFVPPAPYPTAGDDPTADTLDLCP